ncbi:hypothetical protein D3C72_1920860 [compost metagenome]
MQAGDQRVVFHEQRFGAVDVCGADALHALEALVVRVRAAAEGRRRLRGPGDGLDLGRHQQQEGDEDNDQQQQPMMKPDRSAHARTPVDARYLSAVSRSASIDAADSRSIRRLSSNWLAMRIANPLNRYSSVRTKRVPSPSAAHS